eukprot:TRINITY_DN9235_c0_g1_i2.p2 TRINITY_DN9235_c0_g1~~TRINITY_DN9235_c0_g1_i2.p2  ORF type:complete len:50 (+),score=0.52 TRINITY_DN9235_c0_g1_i2:69-218(+)
MQKEIPEGSLFNVHTRIKDNNKDVIVKRRLVINTSGILVFHPTKAVIIF